MKESVYEALTKANIEMDHHESDLYVKSTELSEKIISEFCVKKGFDFLVSRFKNQIDSTQWIEIAFAYDPYWKDKTNGL